MIVQFRRALTGQWVTLFLFLLIAQWSPKVCSSSLLYIPDQVVGYAADFFMEGLRRWPTSEYKTVYAPKMKKRVEDSFQKMIRL